MIKQGLHYVFNPKSVAIVGVSTKGVGLQQATATVFLESLLSCGFKGKVYPVNPKGGEISGLRVYPNIKDIPGAVDYVICGISAPQVPQLITDCIAKGVKAAHIITSGFSESGTEGGKQLEQEISLLARQSGIRIVGPNCMGVYCPEMGLSFGPDFPKESGSVAVISQSGGNAFYIIREGFRRGIRFSKVVSYGNACDVDESDLLEYLACDSDTRIIAAYIEGVNDGRRFYRVLKETAKAKPVIVLKGGITEAGARAAASHTGALASSSKVWDSLLHQAGAIRVCSLEELVDMVVTFSRLSLPSGRDLGILGVCGGATVLATDDCISAGLAVPRFPTKIQDKLEGYLKKGSIGVSLNNPVDLSDQGWDISYDCAKIMLDYGGIDLLIFQLPLGIFSRFSAGIRSAIISIIEDVIKIHKESNKPTAVVIHSLVSSKTYQLALDCERKCCDAGLPVYHSLTNAAKAIARFIDYHGQRRRMLEES